MLVPRLSNLVYTASVAADLDETSPKTHVFVGFRQPRQLNGSRIPGEAFAGVSLTSSSLRRDDISSTYRSVTEDDRFSPGSSSCDKRHCILPVRNVVVLWIAYDSSSTPSNRGLATFLIDKRHMPSRMTNYQSIELKLRRVTWMSSYWSRASERLAGKGRSGRVPLQAVRPLPSSRLPHHVFRSHAFYCFPRGSQSVAL